MKKTNAQILTTAMISTSPHTRKSQSSLLVNSHIPNKYTQHNTTQHMWEAAAYLRAAQLALVAVDLRWLKTHHNEEKSHRPHVTHKHPFPSLKPSRAVFHLHYQSRSQKLKLRRLRVCVCFQNGAGAEKNWKTDAKVVLYLVSWREEAMPAIKIFNHKNKRERNVWKKLICI